MTQNIDQERQTLIQEFDKLINIYYVKVGQVNSAFEDFKNSALVVLNQYMLENQSLKAHLKALQDEKTKDNPNIDPSIKQV